MEKIANNKIKIFYYEYKWGAGFGNFGDVLSPLIIKKYFNLDTQCSHKFSCDLIAIGSILDSFATRDPKQKLTLKQHIKKVRRFKSLDVWGSGMMYDGNVTFHKYMKFHAVRGKLTQKQIGERADNIALGDPGLLSDRLLETIPDKKYNIAFIPHYKDYDNPRFQELCNQFENSIIVDVFDNPLDIISTIAASNIVISTSLHGLIVADSLKVPNIWAEISDKVEGSGYKFRDYYSIYDIEMPKPIDLNKPLDNEKIENLVKDYRRPELEKIKENLIKSFPYK